MNITQYNFSKTQYISTETQKLQIYLHHTAGNSNPFGTYKDWESNKEKIATCVVIGGKPKPKKGDTHIDGQIVQGYSSKYWAYHLGLKESVFYNFDIPYISLDKISIGVEICNWGQLKRKSNKFYTWANVVIPEEEVIELEKEHKGYKYFHDYTDAQIESIKELLLLWNQKYNIPLTYNDDIWDITSRALKGEAGIYTHNSVRYDKVDIYPHPKIINMLKSL